MTVHTYAIETEAYIDGKVRGWRPVAHVQAATMAGARMALQEWQATKDGRESVRHVNEGRFRLVKMDPAAVQVIPFRAETLPGRRVVRLGVAA